MAKRECTMRVHRQGNAASELTAEICGHGTTRLLARTSGMHPIRDLGRLIKARIGIEAELFWVAGFVESHGWCFARIRSDLGLDVNAIVERWSKLGNRGLFRDHPGDHDDPSVSARYLGGDGEAVFLAYKGGGECPVTMTCGTLLQVSWPDGPSGRDRGAVEPEKSGSGQP